MQNTLKLTLLKTKKNNKALSHFENEKGICNTPKTAIISVTNPIDTNFEASFAHRSFWNLFRMSAQSCE